MDAENQLNPYNTPTVAEVTSGKDLPYYRAGDFLYVRDGAELPKRCVHTNLDVGDGGWRKRKQFAWTPPWIVPFIFFGLLPYLILAVALQKKAGITYSLSHEAKERLIRKRGIALGAMVLGIVIASVGFGVSEMETMVIAIVCGVVLAVAGLAVSMSFGAMSVEGERDGWFKLKGCSEDFLHSLPTGIGG